MHNRAVLVVVATLVIAAGCGQNESYIESLKGPLAVDLQSGSQEELGFQFSNKTAECTAQAALAEVGEDALKSEQVTPSNVVSKLSDSQAFAKVSEKAFGEAAVGCFSKEDLIQFSTQGETALAGIIECAIDELGIDEYRKRLLDGDPLSLDETLSMCSEVQ